MNLLFLCTGNACRSQMAEGFGRALAGPGIVVASAGIEAHGLNPLAVKVMAERGIDIGEQTSTRLTETMLAETDLVVTVCAHADAHCPVLPPGTRVLRWDLPDPAAATGSDEEVLTVFRNVRDAVEQHVNGLMADLRDAEPRPEREP